MNNMENKLLVWKTAIVTFFTALGTALGWKGIMLLVWIGVMLLDYLSGTAAACKKGEWCSAKAREGLWHKAGMILVVLVAGIADIVMAVACAYLNLGLAYTGLVLPLVLAWYIITELGSILENAVKLGVKVPAWLTKMLKSSLASIENIQK
jgi:toxin secretion/phage lysis holin